MTTSSRPLVLGAQGQIGRMFQHLWANGRWPASEQPVWHGRARPADLVWDMLAQTLPDRGALGDVSGVIVLASAAADQLEDAAKIAQAALDLADRHALGPVILCSSSAVYGRAGGVVREEDAPVLPNAYGLSKSALESVTATHKAASCCLRIANVVGADSLTKPRDTPIKLDRLPSGQSPARMYIGPITLAKVMLDLIELAHQGQALPPVLNVAAPGVTDMSDILTAADLSFSWRAAPETALPRLELDLTRMQSLVPVSPDAGTPVALINEARAAGWTGRP